MLGLKRRTQIRGGSAASGSRWMVGLLATALTGFAPPLCAMDYRQAIEMVLETHPEISEAAFDKQAIEFELDQARGRYFPRVLLEGRSGPNVRDGTSSSAQGAEDDPLLGWETSARLSQPIFDGFDIDTEVEWAGYRIDAAALRVMERSEFLGLEALKVYTDLQRVEALELLAIENLDYHRQKLAEIQQGVDSGVLGEADLQQARERLLTAENRVTLAQLDVDNARIAFLETVGTAPGTLEPVPPADGLLPETLDAAIEQARLLNPRIRFAKADVGAAEALYRNADAPFYPSVSLEGNLRAGENLDGYRGRDNEAKAEVVVRYEFNGGIDSAARQERLRRVSESRSLLMQQYRYVDNQVRLTWTRLQNERQRLPVLQQQVESSERLLDLYQREFDVGARTLLDLLNTRNSLLQSQIDYVSSQYVELFAQYRVLAAMGELLANLGILPPGDAIPYGVLETTAPGVGGNGDAPRTEPWTRDSVLFSSGAAGAEGR